jgi:sigma-B regulation protein RsbU (phosphoserine phosphatase)
MTSIRGKMLIWFGLTLGILMTAFGITTYSSIKGTVIPLTKDLDQEILKARSAEVGRLIQGYLNEVKSIAGREPIRSGDFAAISQDLVKREHSINPDFEILFFTDAHGRFITTKGAIGNVSDRGYWKAIMEKGQEHAISDPLISKSTGERIFVVANVVTNEKGERIGIAAATVLLKTLSHVAETINIGKSGAGWVVDSTGLVVAHPNPALPMKLNLLKSSAMGYQGLEELGQKIAKGEPGQGSFVRPDGTRLVTIFNPIPNTPGWTFGIVLKQTELMERPESLIRRIAWLMAGMLAIVLLVVIVLSRKITAPVLMLKEGVDIVSTGNLDYQLDIRTGDEIQELADAFNRMTTDLKEHIRNLTETTATKERIQSELNVATDIQASLLPRLFPAFPDRPEFDIFASMDPAKEVGGDFYDFFFIDDNNLCFLIADVAGKGVPAALYMMVAKTLLKSEGQRLGEPDRILSCVNNVLAADNDSCMFATVFCAILDIRSGEVRFANGGHNPPLLLDSRGTRYLTLKAGFVLGPMQDTVYETERLFMQPGDTLFLYTDGVTEAANIEDKLFGEVRLLNALQSGPKDELVEMIHNIRDEVTRHANGALQSDDVTMLAVKYQGRKMGDKNGQKVTS